MSLLESLFGSADTRTDIEWQCDYCGRRVHSVHDNEVPDLRCDCTDHEPAMRLVARSERGEH